MRQAYTSGKPQNVMVHTIRLGGDLWREYAVRFDPERGEVAVRIGPLVNTGQIPYPGTEPVAECAKDSKMAHAKTKSGNPLQSGGEQPERTSEARRQLNIPLVHTYSAEYKVNIFSGPSFRFEREGDQLFIHFLDWHRRWSHSLVLALMVGVLLGVLFGKWAGIVATLGFAAHALEDQIGYMGSNLLWPLTRKRMQGLGLIHSGDAVPNFLTVWTSIALIVFNLDRFSSQARLPQPAYLMATIILPWLLLGSLYIWHWVRVRWEQFSAEFIRQADIIAELDEQNY